MIGADAVEARLGGYSGPGNHKISILDGITAALRDRAPDGVVRYAPGPGRIAREYAVVPTDALSSNDSGRTVRGLHGEYFDNNRLDGSPRLTRTDARVDFGWTLNSPGRGIPFDWYSVRWTGRITIPSSGVKRLGVEANDGYRLYLDGKILIDDWQKRSYGSRLANVKLAPGSSHDVRLEYFESTGNARVKLVWDAGVRDDWRGTIDSAVSRRAAVAGRASSSRDSKKGNSAIARCSRCPGIRKSSSSASPPPDDQRSSCS